jgi:hypothetical protein
MRSPLLLLALLLGGCSAASTGPSLAPRPVESGGFEEPQRTVTAAAPADSALKGQIDAALGDVRRGQAAFAELLGRTEAAAGAAGEPGGESWVAAQQLLSALEAARGPSTSGLAALDTLIANRLAEGKTAGAPEIEAARAEAMPIVAAQDAQIERLRSRISR